MEEKIHVYFREKETGRFVTHFLIDKRTWDEIELYCGNHSITVDEFVSQAIREYGVNDVQNSERQ